MGSSSTKVVSIWIEDSNFTSWSGNTVCPRVQRVLRKLRFGNFYRANGAVHHASIGKSNGLFHRLRGPPCTSTGWHRHYLRDGGPDGKRPGTSLHRAWGDAQMVHRLALGGAAERLLAAEGVR